MKSGIAIAGNLIVDYVKEIDTYPQEGMLSNISSVQMSVGGCVTNTAIDLKKIDDTMEVSAIGMVGDDSNGRYVIDALKENGVDTKGVKISGSAVTSFTDVMTVSDGKARTFFHARGANAVFNFDDIDFEKIDCRFFHIGYALLLDCFDAPDPEYGTVMAKALAAARQKGMETSMDVVSENSGRFSKVVTPSLKYCDRLIINEVEASMICGLPVRQSGALDKNGLRSACMALLDKGVRDRVVIHAPEASCSMDKAGVFSYVPSLRLPDGYIQGTVGAGDAFCAGVLYSLYQEYDIEYALAVGAGAAACNLSRLNSVDGMQNIESIKELIKKYAINA